MATRGLFLASVLFTALVLGAGLAHLYALPNKIGMSRDAYLAAQQIYRGWALLGIFIATALISTTVLAIRVRQTPQVFPAVLTAAVCIVLALIVFFVFTYPANQATSNWTQLPANWQTLRQQWEYSHATGAGLYLVALMSLTVAALNWR